MAWIALVVAGLLECGWPMGLKLGWSDRGVQGGWLTFAIITMAASGALLAHAQRAIPMGTAYAVWTSIGAVGTFLLGILLFGEASSPARFLFVALIVAGVVGLKLSSP